MQIEQLKALQLQARKNKDSVTASLLTTLISEAEMKGKNDGNRLPTPAEIVATVKKFIAGVDETISVLEPLTPRHEVALQERFVLSRLLPPQMTEYAIRATVEQLINEQPEDQRTPKQMGVIMGKMKALYDGQYDGKALSGIVKELLA